MEITGEKRREGQEVRIDKIAAKTRHVKRKELLGAGAMRSLLPINGRCRRIECEAGPYRATQI